MAFMVPYAERIDSFDDLPQSEGFPRQWDTSEDFEPGWYAWLTAPGYLDRTDPIGPYSSWDEAIRAICEEYEVDEDGDPLPEE